MSRSQWLRLALVVTAMLMSSAVIAAAWSNVEAVENASSLLLTGQSEDFFHHAMERFGGQVSTDPSELSAFLESDGRMGARFIELQRPGVPPVAIGTPVAPVAAEYVGIRRPFQTERIGNRVRLVGRLPTFRGASPEMRHHETIFILEYEPLASNQLLAHARRALRLTLAVALAFLGVTAVLWRSWRRHERSLAQAEHEHRLSLLGEMSATLAHEIRNPLTSLKGHAQLLAEALSKDTRERKQADRVVIEAERIEKLTHALLAFVSTGGIERAEVDPSALVRRCGELIHCPVRLDDTRAPASFPLDEVRMGQVVTNLLENAMQAGGPDDVVQVAVSGSPSELRLIIRDYGKGFTEGDEDRIFQAFHTTRTRGVGLGLSVARRIVELHHGTIVARNHPQGGAEFCIALPREA